MTENQKKLIKKSWDLIGRDPVDFGILFYNHLFQIAPETKKLFVNDINEQASKLITMLGYIVAKLDTLEEVTIDLKRLAQRHTLYGVKAEMYDYVGKALLWTLAQELDNNWTKEMELSWLELYTQLTQTIMEAIKEQ
ncbi:MAG: globin domain-containing protein [Alphaproteobacteria bacterium]|nr:globin domain-containing protein [Alphaproteobacteria bacterium]